MNENKKIRKGIVVEILKRERKVIVLMPDGDLQKVRPHRLYKIGEEISFRQETDTKKGWNWSRMVRYATVASVAAIFMLASIFFPAWNGNSPKDVYAEIFIESKSNVQVKLTKEKEVAEVVPLNKSGTRVVNNLDPEGEPVADFIDDYFEAMKKEGYIGAEDKAIISVVSDNHIKTRDDVLTNVKEAIDQSDFIKSNEIEVLTVSIPYQTAQKADQLGITPGKFSIAMIADSVGEENTPSLELLKLITVTELVNTNPEAAKILASTSEVELVELTEQQAPGIPMEAEDGQPIIAMNPPGSNQTVAETTIQHKTRETNEEPVVQTSMASPEKQSKPAKNNVSNTSGNSKPESRPEQTPPPQGNEEPSTPPKQENPVTEKPADEENPPLAVQPAGEVKLPSDKQPADSDQDGNTGSEEKPAEDGDEEKQNEEQANDKNPTILDQVVSLVLNLKVL